jgi:succinate dehydrogenase / fumarate reductase, flavoprotein subunit
MTEDIRRYPYDVVVIGAGGSGLRAAIEARLRGKKTAIISKSLFGKAHTVMAEGGCAAAMGNVNPKDNWQVHFRDTMRGGKFLNNPRMAELHAREAPDRVWELEAWGALFDRTPDGKISQRNFGGHEYPRLAHVGDRTGLEMIRTLQQKIVALQQEDAISLGDPEAMIKVFAETTITRLITTGGRIAGAFGYFRDTGRFVLFQAPPTTPADLRTKLAQVGATPLRPDECARQGEPLRVPSSCCPDADPRGGRFALTAAGGRAAR